MTPTPEALAKAREIVSEHDDVLSDFSDLRHTLIAEFALALDAFAAKAVRRAEKGADMIALRAAVRDVLRWHSEENKPGMWLNPVFSHLADVWATQAQIAAALREEPR